MASENFLVNPPRKRRRSAPKRRRVAKRKMNPAPAKRKRRVRRNTWFDSPGRHRTASKLGWARRKRKRSKRRRNPVGETLMIAGANPRRRRKRYYKRNLATNRHRRYRRNPPQFGPLTKFQRNLPYIFTGGLSAIATTSVPALLGPGIVTSPLVKYGVQLGTAIGGGFVVDMVIPRKGHGVVWMIVGSAVVLADMLQTYVLAGMLPGLSNYEVSNYEVAGNGDDALIDEEGNIYEEGESVGAFPDTTSESANLAAFPNNVELEY